MKKQEKQRQNELLQQAMEVGGWTGTGCIYHYFTPDEKAINDSWSWCNSLDKLYNSCSDYKLSADAMIRNTVAEFGGYVEAVSYRGNSCSFSCNYKLNINNQYILYLFFTKSNNYFYIKAL